MYESRKERYIKLFFILPAFVIAGFVFLYPLYRALEISFYRYLLHRLHDIRFVGFENYRRLFTDAYFWHSLSVTIPFVLGSILLIIVAGIILAGLLHRNKGTSQAASQVMYYYQTVLLLPAIMASSVMGSVFRVFIFSDDIGLATWFFRWIGIGRIPWLLDETWALISIILVESWIRIPLAVLIFSSAMSAIPKTAYEAALVDGASNWRQFFAITLPSIRPQILFVTILSMIQAFRQFDAVFLMTGGGPGHATLIITPFIYRQAMENLNFGYANAAGIVLMALMGILCIIVVLSIKSEEVSWEK